MPEKISLPLQTEPKYAKFEPWDFSELVLAQAEVYKGASYSRGGSFETGSSTDCSGFVQYIYHGFKINLPRSSAEQAQVGKTVTRGRWISPRCFPETSSSSAGAATTWDTPASTWGTGR